MIEVHNLVKRYGQKVAVDNISFKVEKGEILGFLGPNAAGKTTTMRIITGYMPASEGTALVDGFDVFTSPMEVKKRIGYMPENPPLYMDMSVKAYLEFVGRIKGIESGKLSNAVYSVAEKVSITHVLDNHIQKLSKGYRQRVGLAQAMINNPPVLILDEPTVGLDPKQIHEVRELIKNLAGEHTIILSTHILPEVSATAGRVVIINEGKLVAQDTPENLTSRLQGSESLLLEVEGPAGEIKEKLLEMKGVEKVRTSLENSGGISKIELECKTDPEVRKEISRMIIENNWGLLQMRVESMSLEEIFLRLTTEEVAES